MIGPNTICPANKRVLMRDRQQVSGGIAQQEVIQSTCPNTGPILPPPTTAPQFDSWQNFVQITNVPVVPTHQPIQAQPQLPGRCYHTNKTFLNLQNLFKCIFH